MNKKIMAIAIAILLSSTGIVTIALAQQRQVSAGKGSFIPEIWPDPIRPKPRYPKVTVAYGVGLNKVSMETEPVVFLEIKHGGITTIEVLPGDVDRDCDVDINDFELFQASYGKSRGEPGYNPNADFDYNGRVDYKDLLILVRNYGRSCPTPSMPIVSPATKNYLIVGGDIYTMTKIYEKYDWNTRTKIYEYEADDGSIMTAIVQHYNPEGIVSVSAEFKDYLITFGPLYKDRPVITTKIRPFPGLMEKVSKEIDINIENIPTEPIAEWLE